jgi:hypothetical protein
MARSAPPPQPCDGPHGGGADVFAATVASRLADDGRLRHLRQGLTRHLGDAGFRLEEMFLAGGGRCLLWYFRRAGRDTVSAALRQVGVAPIRLWSGTMCSLDPAATAIVDHAENAAPAPGAIPEPLHQLCRLTHRIEPAGALVTADGRVALSFYRAPDLESVRLAQHHASIPAGRAWGLQRLTPA